MKMKKYKKAINKTPLKDNSLTAKNIQPINQIYKENVLEEEFIYEIKTKKHDTINTENDHDISRIKKKTLKRKIKSIDRCKTETDVNQKTSNSPKKVKKKIIKKKKKKKETTSDNGSKDKQIENGSEIPTPNGNDEMENFYLIDYQSKINKNNEDENDQTPDGEEYFHTFHESNFNEQTTNNNDVENTNLPNEENNPTNVPNATQETDLKNENNENLQKSNHSISSNSAGKLLNKKNDKIEKKKVEINPMKIDFNKEVDKDQSRQNKIKNIKSKEKGAKSISSDVSKEKDRKVDNREKYEKEKEKKHLLDIEFAKKRKKILIKKKQNMKAIIIQSVWRMYVMRKIINYYRKFLKFNSLMDSMIKKKLKTFLLFLFEQINLHYNNNKKFKKKKIKLRTIMPRSNRASITEDISDSNIIKDENNSRNDHSLEEKKISLSSHNNDNNEIYNQNIIYNKKSFDINDKGVSLKESVNSMNDKINCKKENIVTIYKNKKDIMHLNANKEEGVNSAKIKYRYRQFRIERKKFDNNTNTNNDIKNDINNNIKNDMKNDIKRDNSNDNRKDNKSDISTDNKNDISNDNSNEEDNLSKSLSYDSKILLSNKKRPAKSPVIQSSSKKENNNHFEKFFKSIPLADSKMKNDMNSFNDINQYRRKISYSKKIIGDSSFHINKNKKNKNEFSIIKFLIKAKDIITKATRNNYFCKILNNIKRKSLLLHIIDKYNNKKRNIMKNVIEKYRIKTQVLKYLDQYKQNEFIDRNNNMNIFNNESLYFSDIIIKDNNDEKLFNENCIETNELTINSCTNKKKKSLNSFDDSKLKCSKVITSLDINDDVNLNEKIFVIDKSISTINIDGEIKFNKSKLIIDDKTSNFKINKQNYENTKFIIDKIISKFAINRSYNKEKEFNDKKLIISKIISNYKINNQNNDRDIFIISKVVGKFNIKSIDKQKNLIITKLVDRSPILYIKDFNNDLIITKKVNNLTLKGKIKNNNYIINKINNNSIIDDIKAFKEKNKKEYYLSLINNNKKKLTISKRVSSFKIKCQKKKMFAIEKKRFFIKPNKKYNFKINKIINYNISGNNLLRKYLYKYNDNKLIITKTSKNLSIKRRDTNKMKQQILNSTSLLKIKSVILKKIQKMIYPKLINVMKRLCFCSHISKFSANTIKKMKISLINNMRDKQLEEKYKKLILNNRYNELEIDKVIDYIIMSKNSNNIFEDERKNKDNNRHRFSDDNADTNKQYRRKNIGQIPKHYFVHKINKLSKSNDEIKINENNNNNRKEIINTKNYTKNYARNYTKNNNKNNTKKIMSNYERKFLEKIYERKNSNFVKGNVIAKIINLFIGHNKQENNVVEIRMTNNSRGNVFKNDNKIYISRFKMSKTRNLKDNNITNMSVDNNNSNNNNINNNNNPTYRKIRQYYSSRNSPYHRKKSSLKENEDNKNIINLKEEKEEKEEKEIKEIKEKKGTNERRIKLDIGMQKKETNERRIKLDIGMKKNNNNKNMNEMRKIHSRFRRKLEESDEESEEEESEFEEDEEESEDIEKAKEILIKYISKKHKILNQKLLNAFNKWKRTKKTQHFVKKVNKNEINVDIYDNGGINRSKKIFIIYRKFNNYSYYMKKILRKWKKITESKRNRSNNEESEDNEKSEFDEEEIEEVEDEEEETEEEVEKKEFRRKRKNN